MGIDPLNKSLSKDEPTVYQDPILNEGIQTFWLHLLKELIEQDFYSTRVYGWIKDNSHYLLIGW